MIKIKIITPLGLYKEGEVGGVHVRTVEGETTILPNHMPIVAMLTTCKCSLMEGNEYKDYAIAPALSVLRSHWQKQLTVSRFTVVNIIGISESSGISFLLSEAIEKIHDLFTFQHT